MKPLPFQTIREEVLKRPIREIESDSGVSDDTLVRIRQSDSGKPFSRRTLIRLSQYLRSLGVKG